MGIIAKPISSNTYISPDELNVVLSPPSDFNLPSEFTGLKVIKAGDSYQSSIQPSDIIQFSDYTNTVYADINRSDDSGDGLSWATAKRSISSAIDIAIASGQKTKVFVKGGEYNRFYSINGTGTAKALTEDIALIAVYGRVTSGNFTPLTWAKTVGQTNVYESARSLVLNVTNPTLNDNQNLTNVASIAECDSTPNSFYTDNVTVYVHTADSSTPSDFNTRVFLAATRGADFSGDYNIYIKSFDLQGGIAGAFRNQDGVTNNVILDDCTCRYAVGGTNITSRSSIDGAQVLACGTFYAFNSDFSYNSKDGLNIHESGGVIPNVLSVNNTGYDNGLLVSNTQSCNGFTTHDGVKSVDIGSTWLGSVGTNSGHVDDNTENWSVGVTAGNSEGDVYNGGGINFGAFGLWSTTNGKMFLNYCTDTGSSIGVYNSGGAVETYVENHTGTGTQVGNINP